MKERRFATLRLLVQRREGNRGNVDRMEGRKIIVERKGENWKQDVDIEETFF